jgi:hypothetical protein
MVIPFVVNGIEQKSAALLEGSNDGSALRDMKSPMKRAVDSSIPRNFRSETGTPSCASPGSIARISFDWKRSSATVGEMVTAAVAEGLESDFAGVIRSRDGSLGGIVRSTALTMRFRCEVKAKPLTRRTRGSAGPEALDCDGSPTGSAAKSNAISMGVTSQREYCVALIGSINAVHGTTC